jgi:hypothetical protein
MPLEDGEKEGIIVAISPQRSLSSCVLWVADWGIGSVGTVRYQFHS